MAKPALQTEDLAWAVHDVLLNELPGNLQEVEARRNAQGRAIVTLPNPVLIEFGFDIEALDSPPDKFPRIAFIAGPRTPNTEPTNNFLAMATHEVLIEWMILAESRVEATFRSWRYGEAILQTLIKQSNFAGFQTLDIVPATAEGQPMEYDTNTGVGQLYLAGGQTTIPMRGMYGA